jgi:hypothetical protein
VREAAVLGRGSLTGLLVGLAAMCAAGQASALEHSRAHAKSHHRLHAVEPSSVAVDARINWEDGVRPSPLPGALYAPNINVQTGSAGEQTAFGANGPVALTTHEVWFESGNDSVDRLRVVSGATSVVPGAPLWLNPSLAEELYDVTYTRGWPKAISLRSNGYGVDVTPHAGFGVTSAGESAEAGATLRFGEGSTLDNLGVGNKPGSNWYFYAEASGRSVGYNLLRGEYAFHSANLFTQNTPAVFSDQQAGIAWRHGAMQASFGYLQRQIRLNNMRDIDVDSHESLVAFTLSFRPGRR